MFVNCRIHPPPPAMPRRVSSLPLQMVLYFNGWYLLLLYVAELAVLIYKAVERPYPAGSLAAEVIMLFVLALLDVIRIFTGAKGNLTGRRLSLSLSLVFLLPVFFGYLYLTVWQTFIERVEYILLAIGYAGLLLELMLGSLTLIVFQRNAVLL